MNQIYFENVSKTFYISKRSEGTKGALKQFIRKKTTEVKALQNVSFDIKSGELVGYIGPNGAGKSTTIKIMSGILTPSGGVCKVNGRIPWKQRKEHVKNLGVVFGQRSQLWWDVPVLDSFNLLRDIYRIKEEAYKAMFSDLVKHLKIEEFLNVPVRQLSLGQRMRCELAASLLHNPTILFLDEPTIGLDAVSKIAVRKFIKEINQKYNTTVILTTHDMDDIEEICNRIIVIGKGQKLFDGTLKELRQQVTRERKLIVDYDNSYKEPEIEGTRFIKQEGSRVEYRFDPDKVKASELIHRVSSEFDVEDVLVETVSIEEIITRLYKVFEL